MPKVGVVLGVANINPGFIAIVTCILHREAKVRQISRLNTLHAAHSKNTNVRSGNFWGKRQTTDDRLL